MLVPRLVYVLVSYYHKYTLSLVSGHMSVILVLNSMKLLVNLGTQAFFQDMD